MADVLQFPVAVDSRFTADSVIKRLEQYTVGDNPPDVSLVLYDAIVAAKAQGYGLHTLQQGVAAAWREWERVAPTQDKGKAK
jgi:hypothetical protein